MKIAITGAAGFLGRHLVPALSDHELCLLGRSKSRLHETLGDETGYTLRETDYSQEDLEVCLRSMDALVHLGATRYRPEYKSIIDYLDNIRVSETLFQACEKVGVTNVVFTSTCSIYSPEVNELPFKETETVQPKNLYAVSKVVSEELGFMRNINLKSLRLAQLVGPGERAGFMLSTFIDCATTGRPLVLFGEGRGQREYLYVKDAVSAIVAALAQPETRGIFNVGSGVSTSHRELAEAIVSVFGGGGGEINTDPAKAEDTLQLLMDSTLFRNIFKWRPSFSLKEGLRDMAAESKK